MVNRYPSILGSGAATTASEALGNRDLSGLTAIVTGGYSGLGLEAVRVLAEAGADVVVPARSPGKAVIALQGIPRIELADGSGVDRCFCRALPCLESAAAHTD